MSENNTEYHVNTDEVLKELQEEGFEVEGTQKEEQPEEQSTEVQETEETTETEVQEEEAQVEEKEINRSTKEPTLIPAWKAKITQEKLEKEKQELLDKIAEMERNPSKENKQEVQETVSDIRKLAKDFGLEIDENQEKFFKALIGNQAVPVDVLKDMQALKQQKEIEYLEQEYDKEFSTDVLPLVKEKFGELPENELAILRNKLHDLAFTEQYAKVALKKVFKAEMDDLKISPIRQPMQTSKSGKTRGTELDFTDVDEKTFANLSDDQLDSFMLQKTGKSGWSRR